MPEAFDAKRPRPRRNPFSEKAGIKPVRKGLGGGSLKVEEFEPVTNGGFKPTAEQVDMIDVSKTGVDFVGEAYAGAAKTSTCVMIAGARPKVPMGYLAYNRSIADDAKGKFSHNVTASTAHSFAYRAVGGQYRDRLNAPRVTNRQAAYVLGLNPASFGDSPVFSPDKLARMVMTAIDRYCYSDDPLPGRQHVEFVPGMESYFSDLCYFLDPYLLKAWQDLQRLDGRLRFTHDMYLKLFVLGSPILPFDTLFVDEAQDANPLIAQLAMMQTAAQKILVGDRNQQIYGWRGAVDAMQNFKTDHRMKLTKSFRFGEAIAEEANKFLRLLGNDPAKPLVGFEQIESKIAPLEDNADCILCRTNAEAINQAIIAQEQGRKAAIVGGTKQIKAFAEASVDLSSGRGTYHPELFAFKNWGEVQEYAHDEAGKDLKVMVNLVDKYGAPKILQICDAAVEERNADVIVSTAHKAKGREWKKVRIASDFTEPGTKDDNIEPKPPQELLKSSYVRAELMLGYVAITRAQEVLDPSGLAWVNRWLQIIEGDKKEVKDANSEPGTATPSA